MRQALGPPAAKAVHTVMAAALRLRPATFEFAGRRLRYFAHPYNETWRNERAVEIPIALQVLDEHRGRRVLEVGNVLAHYGRRGHDVVDKYEQAAGVRNLDILDLEPGEHYDLVLTVSTLEHVGFDEDERDPEKPRAAVERMAGVLAPGGTLLVTVPLGYNDALDRDLRSGRIPFDELRFLKRVSRGNRWQEVPSAAAAGIAYGAPYPWANGVAVGIRRARST
jgi:SAM-dependent methyltransferase